MSFHDVRLPDDIERGASGGPRFNTTILQVDSGQERRNINWSLPLAGWDVGYGIRTKVLYEEVRSFFYLRQGRAFGFRFKDWSDYELVRDPDLPFDSLPMTFTVQEPRKSLVKVYRDVSGSEFRRPITYPVVRTMVLYNRNGTMIPRSDWTWDAQKYEIELIGITGTTADVTVSCEFDIPVRFDTDQFTLTLDHVNAGETPDLPVVELRRGSINA